MVVAGEPAVTHRRWWFAAIGVFVVLAMVTAAVSWLGELGLASLRRRHGEEIGELVARRMQTLIDTHLGLARVFAVRWATHDSRDFSEQRFRDFSQTLLDEMPGFDGLGLIRPDREVGWMVLRSHHQLPPLRPGLADEVLDEARASGSVMVRAATAVAGHGPLVFAIVALDRDGEHLGFLWAALDLGTLVQTGRTSVTGEALKLRIVDGGTVLYPAAPHDPAAGELWPESEARTLTVEGRQWQLWVRAPDGEASSWLTLTRVAMPLLGLLLSFGLACLVYLLGRRIDLYRGARDTALREIEQRHRAQEALRVSEARYRDVFSAASDGLLVLAADGRVIDANPAAGRMYGVAPGALLDSRLGELSAPDQTEAVRDLERRLRESQSTWVEGRHRRRDGTLFDVEIRATPMVERGSTESLLMVTDVSGRKAATEKLEQLSRKVLSAQEEERARLSRELHDELGQMLTALRLEMDWLRRQGESRATGDDAFATLRQLVETATAELRRVCRGLRPPLLDDLGLEPAVQLLVEEFREHSSVAVDLRLAIDEGALPVARETSLSTYRILQEALTNVGRHARARCVTVRLEVDAAGLVAEVKDDGVGFDRANLGRIDGVGLAGMRERAGLVGGTLEIESVVGQGSSITFRAPLRPHQGE
jgi:PAS domain S-box-containing protein